MATEFSKIAKKIAEFIPVKYYLALIDDTCNILHSSLSTESVETLKKLAQIFPLCDIGDFQVKKLKKTNLIIYKLSPNLLLALESYEKEGVIISAAKRIEEKYTELFRTPEKQLQTPPPQETSETTSKVVPSAELVKEESVKVVPSAELVKEVFSTTETKTADPLLEGDKALNEIRERLQKIDNLIKKRKRKLSSE